MLEPVNDRLHRQPDMQTGWFGWLRSRGSLEHGDLMHGDLMHRAELWIVTMHILAVHLPLLQSWLQVLLRRWQRQRGGSDGGCFCAVGSWAAGCCLLAACVSYVLLLHLNLWRAEIGG